MKSWLSALLVLLVGLTAGTWFRSPDNTESAIETSPTGCPQPSVHNPVVHNTYNFYGPTTFPSSGPAPSPFDGLANPTLENREDSDILNEILSLVKEIKNAQEEIRQDHGAALQNITTTQEEFREEHTSAHSWKSVWPIPHWYRYITTEHLPALEIQTQNCYLESQAKEAR